MKECQQFLGVKSGAEKRLKLHQKWNMIEGAKISTFGGKHGVSTLH
jgi:hypothetical protein